ncbi:aminopeptidase P Metallo peptidase. MEROPS family M24B [Arsukibacterium tuosuense]|uniref:Xaa-Pro aminopeptidase n=1 Tax=Arsukibacterium tuosuense TaxID=1323745 RepID=A0A285IDC5_9GAMM|nr:Xaa-Pro aminopeptidase [Arsukibacterium tuosuense]SNY45988.1 aminopeptidase P Metallo peptidase. MEROPS family M24B [Arsukibacterium tuosuense]
MENSVFVQRRAQLIAALQPDSVALISAASEQSRSRDTEYPFRQHSDFWYYTGFNEPDALLIISNRTDLAPALLLCRDKDPAQEVWHGRRLGPAAASETMQLQAAALTEQSTLLQQAINGSTAVYLHLTENSALLQQVTEQIQLLKQREKRGDVAPTQLVDIAQLTAAQRLIKDRSEIAVMRRAGQISAQAHIRAMQYCRPGRFEYQLEAEILHHFALNGARHPAYNSIVGSGENGCILHYTDNSSELKAGDLVLIDAGCELQGYAADISRTFPVSGKFSPEQAELYQLVLDAQYAACNAVQPGSNFAKVTAAAEQVLTEGLLGLGILQGELQQLIADKACKQYFIHGIGHWLGLDVHDVGAYKVNGSDGETAEQPFVPGMLLTIEPGLYIPHGSPTEPRWWDLAIRIEDNLLVTAEGHDNLTTAVPKEIDAIEQLMAASGGSN